AGLRPGAAAADPRGDPPGDKPRLPGPLRHPRRAAGPGRPVGPGRPPDAAGLGRARLGRGPGPRADRPLRLPGRRLGALLLVPDAVRPVPDDPEHHRDATRRLPAAPLAIAPRGRPL